MSRLLTVITVAFVLAAMAAACSDRHADFGLFTPVNQNGWAYGDTLTIVPTGLVKDPATRRMNIGVVHSPDYPYRNLVLEITYPDGKQLRRDTVNIELADVYGSWKGSGMGPSYQDEAAVTAGAYIPDSCRITVRHIMRVDTLRGVTSVGILIDEP